MKNEEKSERNVPQGSYEYGYKGVPFDMIVEELCEEFRLRIGYNFNRRIIKGFIQHLRRICGSNKEYILRMLKCFRDPKGELPKIVEQACAMNYDMKMSEPLCNAIKRAEERKQKIDSFKTHDSERVDAPTFEECEPKMPERLPALIEHLIKNVPYQCRPSAACGVFPALGTLMRGVKFRLVDNSLKEPTFMCVNMAEQSTGKGCINRIVESILSDIKRHDDIDRQRFAEWAERVNRTPKTKDKEKRPEGLYWQWLVSDMTNAAFVRLLEMADGRFLYTKLDEVELLNQLATNGEVGIGKVIHLAFDCGEIGQERVGAESVTAKVRVRWNWNASTTTERGMKFFGNMAADGAVGRINFCTIMPDYEHDFKYGEYDEEYERTLEPYKRCLTMASGLIECDEAKAMARRLLEKCKDIYAWTESVAYDYYMYRAVTIAYMKAMTLYIANGMRWDESIEEFAEWSLDYDMWCKDMFFGKMLEESERRSKIRKVHKGPKNMLGMLENTFTELQLLDVRRLCGKDDKTRHQINVWLNRGLIWYDAMNQVYHKIRK